LETSIASVVELATGGMSNPEIAQSLFVTRKTIEMRLGHAYRKLDVTGPEQLTAVLSEGRPEPVAAT
jgi:DNA-binding NarL/FixJ family response regulator